MLTFDLRTNRTAQAGLREIRGQPPSAATHCTVERRKGSLLVTVNADDPNMLDLISSVTPEDTDRFLYDEDCVQVAIALPGSLADPHLLLVNPHGSRKGDAVSGKWRITTHRHARGWGIAVSIPLAADIPYLGLSVHRFYRGVSHEVQGFGEARPHPLDPAQFAVVILQADEAACEVQDAYRVAAEGAVAQKIEGELDAARKRLADMKEQGGPSPSLDEAMALAERRAKAPVVAAESFLCWNEAHYQLALIDLWEVTGDPNWLEMAIPRIEEVWSARADRRGIRDALWGKCLPTWYNDTETGSACTLVSGAILNPIVRLMRAAHDEPRLAGLWERVKEWVPLCEQVIALHDREWVEFPDGSGMHLEPYGKGPRRVYPSGGSRINPLNREYFLGLPMLNLVRITGNDEYRRKVEMMARYFRNTSEVSGDRFVWEYWASRYPAEGEDLNHASCQLRFAELCCQEGVVFSEGDLRKIAGTLKHNVFRYGDVPCGMLRGYHPELNVGIALWSSLCRFVPELFPRIVAVVETAMREGQRYFQGEGWGVRILTSIERARGCMS